MVKYKYQKDKSILRPLLKFIFSLVGFTIFLGFLLIFLIYTGFWGPLPEKEELADLKDEEATLVLSSDNRLIGKIFAKNRTSISRDAIPDHLIDALIAVEDTRFYEHNGMDSRSLARVVIKSIIMGNRSSGGGSTITQQLAKNLYGRKEFGFLTIPVAKIREAILALRLEKVYSKEEILQLYLNTVPFGEDAYGIEAATNRYFNKSVDEIEPEESALLVGMLKANTYYHPRLHPERALERRNLVFDLMAQQEKLTGSEVEELKNKPIKLDYANFSREGPAQYFLYQVEQESRKILNDLQKENGQEYNVEKDGLKIKTTLDSRLQEISRSASRQQLSRMQAYFDQDSAVKGSKKVMLDSLDNTEKKLREIWTWDGIKVVNMTRFDSAWHYHKMLHSGVLIMEPHTGKIRAWVGGNHFRYLPFDLVKAKRMIASAFKPVLYSAALENGYDPCDYFDNTVKTYAKYEDWSPANYDNTSGDEAAMWYALANSLNLPTVDLYFKTGHRDLEDMCYRLGIEDLPDNSPSISLGAIDLSLKDMISVYGAFASGGHRTEPLIIEKITDNEGRVIYKAKDAETWEVMDQKTAFLITSMLQKAVNEGTGIGLRSQFNLSSDLAGKTGTSQNFSDAWFFGYNPRLVCGAWVGARDPDMHFSSGAYGSGSALALPIVGNIWQNIEKDPLLNDKYITSFQIPSGYTRELDCEGTRTSGAINRLIENIFGKKDQSTEDEEDDDDQKSDSGVKKFFKRLFGKDQ